MVPYNAASPCQQNDIRIGEGAISCEPHYHPNLTVVLRQPLTIQTVSPQLANTSVVFLPANLTSHFAYQYSNKNEKQNLEVKYFFVNTPEVSYFFYQLPVPIEENN